MVTEDPGYSGAVLLLDPTSQPQGARRGPVGYVWAPTFTGVSVALHRA